jgi:hypothetical protein
LLALLSSVSPKAKKGVDLSFPVNSMPESLPSPAHDHELWDRDLMPVLDLAQDRFQIVGNRALALSNARLTSSGVLPVLLHISNEYRYIILMIVATSNAVLTP